MAQRIVIPAMPIEQQRLLAAQQMGHRGGMPMPNIPIPATGPSNPPPFFIPDKPRLVGARVANTAAFTAALGVICLNAAWGEPVAILMCSSGLVGIAYKMGKEVVVFMASHIK